MQHPKDNFSLVGTASFLLFCATIGVLAYYENSGLEYLLSVKGRAWPIPLGTGIAFFVAAWGALWDHARWSTDTRGAWHPGGIGFTIGDSLFGMALLGTGLGIWQTTDALGLYLLLPYILCPIVGAGVCEVIRRRSANRRLPESSLFIVGMEFSFFLALISVIWALATVLRDYALGIIVWTAVAGALSWSAYVLLFKKR